LKKAPDNALLPRESFVRSPEFLNPLLASFFTGAPLYRRTPKYCRKNTISLQLSTNQSAESFDKHSLELRTLMNLRAT
jgi:hypothetical protein